eukprot:NODE_2289_length_726_cov_92.429838_g1852_i0.p1 GENE.NODE_2289_length_726_cov_92.429838_g1852_i0~~NODE_2289_length_726_cov_92.429838_g1852_i0.p1  ORF type:complete len:171 (-),score=50.64 NODE_2289_length_726_cov_92.429838_g1852_i0:213-668(-)
MKIILLLAVLAAVAMAKPACNAYFGEGTDGSLSTVVDPTIIGPNANPYCEMNNLTAPCTFIHYSGPASKCISPGPPDVGICHRYIKTTYSACPALTTSGAGWAGNIDKPNRFFRTGVLKGCENNVLSQFLSCWTAPADNPVPCNCSPPDMW